MNLKTFFKGTAQAVILSISAIIIFNAGIGPDPWIFTLASIAGLSSFVWLFLELDAAKDLGKIARMVAVMLFTIFSAALFVESAMGFNPEYIYHRIPAPNLVPIWVDVVALVIFIGIAAFVALSKSAQNWIWYGEYRAGTRSLNEPQNAFGWFKKNAMNAVFWSSVALFIGRVAYALTL